MENPLIEKEFILESDSGLRKDIQFLKQLEIDNAEVEKLALEEQQRKDKILRTQCEKKRKAR